MNRAAALWCALALAGCARPVAQAPEGIDVVASACTAERLVLLANRRAPAGPTSAIAVACTEGHCREEAIGPGELTGASFAEGATYAVVDGRLFRSGDGLSAWTEQNAPEGLVGVAAGERGELYAWWPQEVAARRADGTWDRVARAGPLAGLSGAVDREGTLVLWIPRALAGSFDSSVVRIGAPRGDDALVPSTGDMTVAGAIAADGTLWLLGLARDNTLTVRRRGAGDGRDGAIVLRVPLTVPRTLQVAGNAVVVGARGGDVHSESMLLVSRDHGATWTTGALPVRVATALCASSDGTTWSVDALGRVFK